MLKTLLLGGAMLIAMPALAQTTSTGTGTGTSGGTPTTTNDHDPTMESSTTAAGTANGSVSTQVNSGTTSASTMGTGAGGTAVDHSQHQMGATGTMSGQTGTSSGTMSTTGTTGSTTATGGGSTTAWSDTGASGSYASSGMNGGMSRWSFGSDLGTIGSRDWGVTAMSGWGGGSPSASGSAGVGSGASASGSFTGMGGPVDIDSQWSTISASGGDLTPLDFGTWLLEQNGQNVDTRVESTRRSRASNLPAIQVLNLTQGAFAAADTNNDMRISQDELRSFAGS